MPGQSQNAAIAPERQAAATNLFQSYVQNLFLDNPTSTALLTNVYPGQTNSRLTFKLAAADDSHLLFLVKSDSAKTARAPTYKIEVDEIDSAGVSIASHTYEVVDGGLIRTDHDNAGKRNLHGQTAKLGKLAGADLLLKAEGESEKLEQSLGLNRQPVGPDEVNDLAILIDESEVVPLDRDQKPALSV